MVQGMLKVPPLIFGCNVLGWTVKPDRAFALLDGLYEQDIRYFDTADTYGQKYGLSEEILGKWIKARGIRQKVFIATKGGRQHHRLANGEMEKTNNNSPDYLKSRIEGSLKRLQTDYVDLYYTHFDDGVTPLEVVLKTHQEFLDSGKTRYIGASNYSRKRLQKALNLGETTDLPKYDILQTEYNLVERKAFETELRELSMQYHLPVATYFSLASGFLTGKYRKEEDFLDTARVRMTKKYLTEENLRLLTVLDKISRQKGISMAATSLLWTLQQPGINSCIVSATKLSHLDAFTEVENHSLSVEELQKLTISSDY